MADKIIYNTNDSTKPILTINGDAKINGKINVAGTLNINYKEILTKNNLYSNKDIYSYCAAGFADNGDLTFGTNGKTSINGKNITITYPKANGSYSNFIIDASSKSIANLSAFYVTEKDDNYVLSYHLDHMNRLPISFVNIYYYIFHEDEVNGQVRYLINMKRDLIAEPEKLVTQERLVTILHPVNGIYQSFDSSNPADIFGGTWESITCPYSGAYAWKRTA